MTFPPGANTEGQGQAFLIGNPIVFNLPAPVSYSGAQVYLASDLVGGVIVQGGTASTGLSSTLPTAALLVAALKAIYGSQLQIGAVLECLIINGIGGTGGVVTLLAGSGGAFDPNQAAASQTLPAFTSKFILIRITNITPGSEAYVIYS